MCAQAAFIAAGGLGQELAAIACLLERRLPLSAVLHIAAALIKGRNSRRASALAQNISIVFFTTIISSRFGLIFFFPSSLRNGDFLASRAVFWQAALLGLTAASAVLMINFADRCGFCPRPVHFSLASARAGIPARVALTWDRRCLSGCTLTSLSLQIPRYILTLHELLAHTPHEHIERNSLDYAKSKLEELSRYLNTTANCPTDHHISEITG